MDPRRQFAKGDLALDEPHRALEPRRQLGSGDDLLGFVRLQTQLRHDMVAQALRIFLKVKGGVQLGRTLGARRRERDRRQLPEPERESLNVLRRAGQRQEACRLATKAEHVVHSKITHRRAMQALHQHLHAAVRQAQRPQHPHRNAHCVYVIWARVLEACIALEHQHKLELMVKMLVHRLNSGPRAKRQRRDHTRERDSDAKRDCRY